MAYLGPVRRWDILWADLEPIVGREQAGTRRPVLIVSSNLFSTSTQLVVIVPLTAREGKTRRFYPFEIALPTGIIDEGITPVAMTHQLRSVSKLRLLEYAGRLNEPVIQGRIEDALIAHLGIELEA